MKKVTQIVSYYNEEKYIEESINSLLSQSYENLEIILIDDGSTDSSRSIVNKFDDSRIIRIDNDVNHGQAYCRNQGLDLATGEYIGFFDADDINYISKIEVLKSYLDSHYEIDIVGGLIDRIDEEGILLSKAKRVEYVSPKMVEASLLFGNQIATSCTLFRKSIIDNNHIRNNIILKASQDFDFWNQCVNSGARIAMLKKALVKYRVHNSSTKRLNSINQIEEYNLMIFDQAWKNKGILLSDEELKLVYLYLYKGKHTKDREEIRKLLELEKRLKKELESEIKKEILFVYHKKMCRINNRFLIRRIMYRGLEVLGINK